LPQVACPTGALAAKAGEPEDRVTLDPVRCDSGLAVDSLDSDQDVNAERFIAPDHIIARVISAGVV
jgi:hypothetical protein